MQKDESQISRQARWQRKHRAMGLCVLCSRPAYKGWRCKKHYEQHKITMRLRYIPKVRGRYKVGGTSLTEAASRRKSTKTGAKRSRTAAGRSTGRKSTSKKTSARKTTMRKSTGRRTATKRAAKG
jgi:hypothetical protein